MVNVLCMVNQYVFIIMERIMVVIQNIYPWEMSRVANVLWKITIKDIARTTSRVAFEKL